MSDKKITVVVPCYNVENYLERCVDSLLNQTFKDIDIILVDDCSSDGTKKIIQKYEKNHTHIVGIYGKENLKQGHARNTAIRIAKTEYITFIDSDDWVEPNFLEVLYDTITANSAEIAVCDIFVRYDDPAADFRVTMYNPRPDRYGLINVGFAASSSNKLFKTKILKDHAYPEDIINEDVAVVLAAMYKYKTAYTNETYYNYYQRPGSTQNGDITSKRFDIFKAVALLKDNVGSRIDKKTWNAIVWHQIIQLFLSVLPRAEGILHRRRLIKEFTDLAKKDAIDIVHNPNLLEFMRESRTNKLYIGSLIKLLNNKQFSLISVLMGSFIFYQRHKNAFKLTKKIIRAPYVLVTNPSAFYSKLKAIVVRKYVIKKNITLDSLVVEAKRQQKLPSTNPVSVVIPNYNYEKFLIQRMYSILYQTRKVGEILILDDNSTDNSVKLAKKIQKAIGKHISVRLINNTVNQGTFKQWARGFSESRYDYVWIAEADDYCSSRFLESTLRPLDANESVVLSYTDTGFINEEGLFLDSVKVHIDYQESGHWNKDYVNNGLEEVKNYSYLNNTIANVSSVVFRKKAEINYSELFALSRDYKQAGDWVFYVNYILHGDVAYTDKPINYYRLHGSNVSSKTKAIDHLNEIYRVYDMLNNKLHLSKAHAEAQKKRIKFLKKAWNI